MLLNTIGSALLVTTTIATPLLNVDQFLGQVTKNIAACRDGYVHACCGMPSLLLSDKNVKNSKNKYCFADPAGNPVGGTTFDVYCTAFGRPSCCPGKDVTIAVGEECMENLPAVGKLLG